MRESTYYRISKIDQWRIFPFDFYRLHQFLTTYFQFSRLLEIEISNTIFLIRILISKCINDTQRIPEFQK
jgi:hypothetical protein